MFPVKFQDACYIKLGRAGEWEKDSIETGKLRLGWRHQSIEDITAGHWDVIEKQLRANDGGKRNPASTSDLNALKMLAGSGDGILWITFYRSKLWWARLKGPVQQDSVSKFRLTAHPWCDRAADGRLLVVNELPGKIARVQGFRATVCRIKNPDLLERTLNATRSPLASAIRSHREALAQHLTAGIKELHWKDFETLVDLVFRAAGWVRVSVLGQHEKGYDLLLREPVTGRHSVVQVKSQAGRRELKKTIDGFSSHDFRRVFFVVHSPAKDLTDVSDIPSHVEVIPPQRLGELAMDAGLAGWVETKVT